MSSKIPLREGQFTLSRLFLVMAAMGVFFGLAQLGDGGPLAGIAFLLVVVSVYGHQTGQNRTKIPGWATIVMVVALVSLLVLLLSAASYGSLVRGPVVPSSHFSER